MNIGIDKIGFYSPEYFIDMRKLAVARNIDPDKFTYGLGQDLMAVKPITQDTITMGANAANTILNDSDKEAIDLVILATETGLDFSKSGATSIHSLLGINAFARCIEMKQACYSATAAIAFAQAHIAMTPGSKALVIASDTSRYGLNTSGEPTQGAGAVAMLISEEPRILQLETNATYFTDDILDFWRPNYSDVALVDGKYSNEQYQRFFETVINRHFEKNEMSLADFNALCFHIPYTKMGLKALRSIVDKEERPDLYINYTDSTLYNRQVGNIYTGSLYLSLLSLLEKGTMKPRERIGLFSYGSGAVGEFFSGILQPDYKEALINHELVLNKRQELSIKEYERMYNAKTVENGSHQIFDTTHEQSVFYMAEIKNNARIYKTNK
ncbi:hydroxymethylglutaryl-CoA synthase [Erysipelothrix inopinata]|uniref:Hydroxymethylglutaryl-CoA synthase n=1 Tax=Erysipelothrix inopinata TaxID=225084 RepID=A0A7G9S088_9FIRM|nr:hydroxymethylglutaryl-CoA synthase [Erysipelothrix inopinata]QNN61263.1 hydroxymethylglutaryl-CoA synthase [Erysipelothrix inopinata]